MRLPITLGLVSALALMCAGASADDRHGRDSDDFHRVPTATPIKHVVVIFQENVSFDHYFGTYPNALNLSGETPFKPSPRTPKVNNLVNPLDVNHDFQYPKYFSMLPTGPSPKPTRRARPALSRGPNGVVEAIPSFDLVVARLAASGR